VTEFGKHVYVASPMRLQPIDGPRAAAKAADQLVAAGHFPYLPQLDRLWAYMTGEKDVEIWLRMDFAWIRKCDAMVRLPGESAGADREVAFAKSIGIPVFKSVSAFLLAGEHSSLCGMPGMKMLCAKCGEL
jgi:hypothetical protein